MIRRLFWALLGLGLGLVLGARIARQLDRVTDAAKPGAVAERTGHRVGGAQSRLQHAIAVGRAHGRAREAELRARYGVPTLDDVARLTDDGPTGSGARPDADAPDDD